VIAAMLKISDSRFQGELIREAKDAGKLARDYEIPASHRENYPERITEALKGARQQELLPSFPFGSDFTDVEQQLIPALQRLRDASASPLGVLELALLGLVSSGAANRPALARLGLDKPKSLSDWIYRLLVSAALGRH
jgi:hypothetical protein